MGLHLPDGVYDCFCELPDRAKCSPKLFISVDQVISQAPQLTRGAQHWSQRARLPASCRTIAFSDLQSEQESASPSGISCVRVKPADVWLVSVTERLWCIVSCFDIDKGQTIETRPGLGFPLCLRKRAHALQSSSLDGPRRHRGVSTLYKSTETGLQRRCQAYVEQFSQYLVTTQDNPHSAPAKR